MKIVIYLFSICTTVFAASSTFMGIVNDGSGGLDDAEYIYYGLTDEDGCWSIRSGADDAYNEVDLAIYRHGDEFRLYLKVYYFNDDYVTQMPSSFDARYTSRSVGNGFSAPTLVTSLNYNPREYVSVDLDFNRACNTIEGTLKLYIEGELHEKIAVHFHALSRDRVIVN